MKRQLDRLKGKRLVTGDPNLMTKDEICINATPNGVEVKEIGTDGKIKDLAGSGGEGVNEYYYKWKDDADKFSELFDLIATIGRVKNIINGGRLFYNLTDTYSGEDFSNKELMRDSDAFCIFGEETPIVFADNYTIIPKGNLIDKINVSDVLYPSEDVSQIIPLVIDYVNNNLTEITKEEYESLITYKP